MLKPGLADGSVWRRSSRCNGGGCVEVSAQGGMIMVRSSADPECTTLVISRSAWLEWLSRAKKRTLGEA
jgi:hypothetical protein